MAKTDKIKKKDEMKNEDYKNQPLRNNAVAEIPPDWEDIPITRNENPRGMLCKSQFSIMFPSYREKYLQECWPLVENSLKTEGLECELDVVKGTMSVWTTRKTFDPYIVIKSRDMIRLMSRSVPFDKAVRVLRDDMTCDIIKIGGTVRNKGRFIKRRQRLIGPDGSTLKAIELLTKCYVLIQGNTVAAIGPFKGVVSVRQLAMECMKNIHPIYQIKTLMIKKELEKDTELKKEDWYRFLPHYKKKNISRRKGPYKKNVKKEYTPFPPPQLESKVDKELASGEFFLTQSEKKIKQKYERREREKEVTDKRMKEKTAPYIQPKEDGFLKRKITPTDVPVDIERLKKKVKVAKKNKHSHSLDTSNTTKPNS